jgi:hypothetical protein
MRSQCWLAARSLCDLVHCRKVVEAATISIACWPIATQCFSAGVIICELAFSMDRCRTECQKLLKKLVVVPKWAGFRHPLLWIESSVLLERFIAGLSSRSGMERLKLEFRKPRKVRSEKAVQNTCGGNSREGQTTQQVSPTGLDLRSIEWLGQTWVFDLRYKLT